MVSVVRYTDFPFPAQKYLPGEGVHPSKQAEGEHIPGCAFSAVMFGEATWQDADRYLYAIDLFNHGYWWETHEILEDIWNDVGPRTPVGLFIQGLIQIAASLIKKTQSFHNGANRLAQKGLTKINMHTGIFLGVDVEALRLDTTAFVSGDTTDPPIIHLCLNRD